MHVNIAGANYIFVIKKLEGLWIFFIVTSYFSSIVEVFFDNHYLDFQKFDIHIDS